MVIDGHVHTRGHERADAILRAMDRIAVDALCLISPPHLADAAAQRGALDWMKRLTASDPARLLGYYWLNPVLPEAPEIVAEASAIPGIRAFKLMSDHWFPHDERVIRVLSAIDSTERPVLFHAGILWSHMDSSRFCRPAEFEAMLHFPRLKFALAHMAWPWIDECMAVAARMRDGIKQLTGGENSMYVDLSPGTPLEIREESLRRAVLLGDTNRFIYGSDDSDPEELEKAGRILQLDREILRDRIGLDAEACDSIFGLNQIEFLGMTP